MVNVHGVGKLLTFFCRSLGLGFLHAIWRTAKSFPFLTPPAVPIAEWIRQAKGSSGHLLRNKLDNPVQWASGYAVFSLRKSNVDTVRQYIRCQEQHHRAGTVVAEWEWGN